MFKVPEVYRVTRGMMASDSSYGNNGAFVIPYKGDLNILFSIIASDGEGWEHVSITIIERRRCPRWEEMCYIKKLFWDDSDCVIQYHPSSDQYVNNHPYCLHLWRPTNQVIPIPDFLLVGVK